MSTSHPLDPLTPEEISTVTRTVLESSEYARLERGGRFITIELREPAKAVLLERLELLERGEEPPGIAREADVVLLDRADATTHEVCVGLSEQRVIRWTRLEGVQPLAVVEELAEAEELVKRDPEFRAALAKRGVTDFDAVQIDAWPAGNFGDPSERGRLARCVAFLRPQPGDSEWAHPVDGLIALVDLNALEVLRIDDHGVVPIPPEPGNFDVGPRWRSGCATTSSRSRSRSRRARASRSTAGGALAELGAAVGFTPARGTRPAPGRLRDQGGAARSCTAPRSRRWSSRTATRARRTTSRTPSTSASTASASRHPRSTSAATASARSTTSTRRSSTAPGEPLPIPNAICMHEEDVGLLWKHTSGATARARCAASRRLVISSFSAIGNYDYGFFWYLYQDGTIGFEVKLTGVLSTGAVAPGERPAHGTLVAPGPQRDDPPALLQRPARPRRRRRREHGLRGPHRAAPAGPENPLRQRVRGRRRALRDRARGASG